MKLLAFLVLSVMSLFEASANAQVFRNRGGWDPNCHPRGGFVHGGWGGWGGGFRGGGVIIQGNFGAGWGGGWNRGFCPPPPRPVMVRCIIDYDCWGCPIWGWRQVWR